MRVSIAAAAAAIALTGLTDSLLAQRAPIRFGVLAGANLSSINSVEERVAEAGNGLLANERRAGGQAALYATFSLGSRFSVQPELHYIQKGGKASITLPTDPEGPAIFDDDRLTLGVRLSYVEIPLLARFELASASRSWRPFLIAGPSFSLKTGCTASTEIGTFKLSGSCSDEASLPDDEEAGATEAENPDPVRETDFGAIAGVGVQGSFLSRQFSVQLRYMHGLRSIASEQIVNASPKNRGFALVMGLGF
jgi:hypothetical protein